MLGHNSAATKARELFKPFKRYGKSYSFDEEKILQKFWIRVFVGGVIIGIGSVFLDDNIGPWALTPRGYVLCLVKN